MTYQVLKYASAIIHAADQRFDRLCSSKNHVVLGVPFFFAALLKNGMYSPRQTGFSGTATVNKVMLVRLNNLFSMFPANDQLPLDWTQNMARCQKVTIVVGKAHSCVWHSHHEGTTTVPTMP